MLSEKVKQLRGETESESDLIYLNAYFHSEYSEVIQALKIIRKFNVGHINLLVEPENKNNSPFNVLQVKLPPEPNQSDITKPNPLMLVLTLLKDGRVRLNNQEFKQAELKATLPQIFKERESNGIFREGTNEVDKTIYIKAPRSANYGSIVNIVDAATGAGATPIFLQLDDLES